MVHNETKNVFEFPILQVAYQLPKKIFYWREEHYQSLAIFIFHFRKYMLLKVTMKFS